LLCEANQWPEDVRPYFGDGDEFHMGFHFPIMPRLYMALKKGRFEDMAQIMRRTPAIPENCQWCTFLRNHDELTLEMVTEEERQWMWDEYAPDPRMRLNLGIRRRLAPLLDNDRRKIELANSLLFSLPGSPILYYGDEIGMGDNIWLPDRNGVRTPMQWTNGFNAGFSLAPTASLYTPMIREAPFEPASVNVAAQRADPASWLNVLQQMIAIRKGHKAFGWGDFEWLDVGTPTVAAYTRTCPEESLLVIHNLRGEAQNIELPAESGAYTDLFTGQTLSPGLLALHPYQYLWLQVRDKSSS
jgi:maltose alpha-D-glucosyltransferase/alpha-amylase